MPRHQSVQTEYPRSEPEIIPPARDRTQAYDSEWFSTGPYSASRVFVARFGGWRLLAVVLAFGLTVGVVLALVLGALLFMVPVIGLLVVLGVIASQMRAHMRGPRG
jgi:hypothetical protein